MKCQVLLSALGLWLLVPMGTVSCGSSSSKKVVPPSGDAGEAGEAPVSHAGAPARGGNGGVGPGAGGTLAGGGGTLAGAGGTLAGAGGTGGEALAGAAGAEVAPGEAGSGGEGGASAATLLVYNTGVDDQGVVLPGGSVDPHYTLIQSPDPTYKGPNAIVTTEIAQGYWLSQSDTSKWIAPTPNQSYPGATPCNEQGTYVWRTTFTLSAAEVASFKLNGGWAADNSGPDVRLNDNSLGISTPSYSVLNPFTIESGFVAGTNTLDFEVKDIGCPNGLRVELSVVTPGT